MSTIPPITMSESRDNDVCLWVYVPSELDYRSEEDYMKVAIHQVCCIAQIFGYTWADIAQLYPAGVIVKASWGYPEQDVHFLWSTLEDYAEHHRSVPVNGYKTGAWMNCELRNGPMKKFLENIRH